MKIKYFKHCVFALIFLCLLFSCKKEQTAEKITGYLKFGLDADYVNLLKSGNADNQLSTVMISIDKTDGTPFMSLKKIPIQNYNGIFITEPLLIEAGTYRLTFFALLDASEQIKFAAPLSGSTMAAYVKIPLSIDFSILKDQTLTLVPEVLSTIGVLSSDFGFTSMKFYINKSIIIFPYAFLPSISSYELTTADLTISDGLTNFSSLSLSANENIIELPDKSNYVIKIKKTNYITYQHAFTKAEIESMVDPLIVILRPEIPDLMASYTFEGNINDVSGNGRNGTFNNAVSSTDRFGMANSAYSFSGSSYIALPISFDVLPRTISLWFYTNNVSINNPLYGTLYQSDNPSLINGSTGIAIKEMDGSKKLLITACAVTDTFDIVANRWYHVAMTVDASKNINYYVDGVLIGSKYYTLPYVSVNGVNYAVIGGARDLDDNFFNGKIDDVRIYNRSLSSLEIKSLYIK